MMHTRLAAGLALAFVIGLGACTSGRDVARLENPKAFASPGAIAFRGVLESPGGSQPPGSTRYVFHTHGMGLTNADQALIAPLKAAFGLAGYVLVETTGWRDSPTAVPHAFIGEALPCPPGTIRKPCLFNEFGEIRVDRYFRSRDNARVVVFNYFWHGDLWSLQEPFVRQDLEGLKSGFGGWNAGVWSGGLKKKIVNEGLSDVAAYLGPAGQPLRQGMSTAVCALLREAASGQRFQLSDLTPSLSRGPSECLDQGQAERLLEGDSRIAFISHSLGSRMLFDVLADQPDRTGGRAPPGLGLVATRQVTDTFIMAANQVSLLGIGRIKAVTPPANPNLTPNPTLESRLPPPDACPDSLPDFLAVDCRPSPTPSNAPNKGLAGLSAKAAAAYEEPRNLDIVGFFDPGDVLGYSLEGGRAEGTAPATIRFLSVLHRNTHQLAWKGSLPHLAHDRELALKPGGRAFVNPRAVALILCGGVSDSRGGLSPGGCLAR
jgi:hypothetical protein